MTAKREHKVTIVVQGNEIGPWSEYEIHSSMIEPSDAFTLSMPWDAAAWNALPRDANVRVLIDGVAIVDGFIDRRSCRRRDGTLTVTGRDRGGRLVQESAPAINYSNLTMFDAIKKLISPWFSVLTFSDARNRKLRRGRGRRVPAGSEPIVVNIKVVRSGKVHPGMTRWAIIEEIVSEAGYCAWSSADGKEFFVGLPNYSQAAQFLLAHPRVGSNTKSTVLELEHAEDNGDRFSKYICTGAGGATESDYGSNVTNRAGSTRDGLNDDGTGEDFIHQKILVLPERDYASNGDALRVAVREQARRDFRRTVVTCDVEGHGQFLTGGARTLFAPNTIARILDEDFEPPLDDSYLIVSCVYKATRDDGETTQLELVPDGTQVVL